MNMRKYRPKYHRDRQLYWTALTGKRRKRTYPLIDMEKIILREDFEIRQDILEQSKTQFLQSGELIPVLLSPDNELLNGYEQYQIAKEMGKEKISFCSLKLSKKESYQRRKAKAVKRRQFTKAERRAVFDKCGGKCSRCGKKLQIDDYKKKDTYMTIDHVKKISHGGTYDISNLIGLCYNCHQYKDNLGKLQKKKGKKKRAHWIPPKKKK